MPEPLLQANCQARLGDFELDVQFELQPAFAALFGPSGCGKTTTLKLLAGLLRPHRGMLRIAGRTVVDTGRGVFVPPEARDVGLVFQDARLFPHLSVRDNLLFGQKKRAAAQQPMAFDRVVQLLGIGHLLQRRPRSLSGGETQRVAIGRALLAGPRLLLMDEPLAALDMPAKLAILSELQNIHREFGMPILYVSHDLGTVMNIASQVLLMRQGKIIRSGPAAEVLQDVGSSSLSPREKVRNVIEATVLAHNEAACTTCIEVNGAELHLPLLEEPPGQKIRLQLPASEIILAAEEPRGLSARNVLPGEITAIKRLGQRVFVTVHAGYPWLVEIVEGTVRALDLRVGKRVFLVIKATGFRRME